MPAEANLTLILNDWANGDQSAIQRLLPLVYPDLRTLASAQLRKHGGEGTLQTTAVVNELFLKLLGRRPPQLDNRKHFYVLAARIMRAALVDHYRQTYAQKRGGGLDRVALHDDLLWVDATSGQVVDLDRALEELEALDSLQADLFGLRYLLGCTAEETALLSGLSKATVDRKLKLARAWLFQRLHEAKPGPSTND
jgi:RNA polymerase sigma factor (TIGR02999 family)